MALWKKGSRTPPALAVLVFALAAGSCLRCATTQRTVPVPGVVSGHSTAPQGTSASTRAQPESRAPSILKVLTYNLYVYNQDIVGTTDLIRRFDADVVALQETIPSFETAFRSRLSDLYPSMEFFVGPIGNGPGILSKTPWTSGRYVASKAGYNGYWIGQFRVGGRTVQLVNVHLHPTAFGSWSPLSAWSAYRSAEDTRIAQVEELIPLLAAGVPTLLLGDFNSPVGSPTLERLEASGYKSGLSEFEAERTPTFRLGGIATGLGFHIDHVLLGPELCATSAAVVSEGSSDHLPVVATISWASHPSDARPAQSR